MKNNIITIVLVVVVALVAIWYLTKTDTSTSYLTTSTQTTNSTDAIYIYSLLQKMSQVSLEDTVFSNPVFKSLKDNTVTFPEQPAGRNNPFAPIGTDTNITGQQSTVLPL